MTDITINAHVSVVPKDEAPMLLTKNVGTFDCPAGEKVEFLVSYPAPTTVILRGEKLTGTIDLMPLIQEALLHVLKANAVEAER